MAGPGQGGEMLQSDGGGSNGSEGRGLTQNSFQKLCADLEALIRIPDQEYSDLTIVADGQGVPVHRCILAARCPGLRKVFAEMEQNGNSTHLKLELELSTIVGGGKIGYEALVAVVGYVYGGKMEPWPPIIACCDSSCAHLTCRPAIDYVLEVLRASLLFHLPEVKTVAQHHLIDSMGKFQVDDMLHVHRSTSKTECSQLQSACLIGLASSTLDNLTLEREFSGGALEQVRRLRKELGLDTPHLTPFEEKQCKRIHRALDSDDLELVRLLLDEEKLSLDRAHGLHYAAAFCHPRTLAHLLDMELADTNIRNERGMTVLHVAAWRREPQAIANLLENGALLKELTLDDQTALDISRRLSKKSNLDKAENQKERLCISILEQAGRKHTVVVPKSAAAMLTEPSTEKELMSALLYLENRVALARLLYPQEADVIMGVAHLDSFRLQGVHVHSSGSGTPSKRRKPSADLIDEPAQTLAGLVGVFVADESQESRLESLRQRCDSLRKAVEAGRRYFPCYSAVIDKYVLDDDPVESNDEGNPEDQLLKKRHFAEIKGILQDSSPRVKANDQKKVDKPAKMNKKPRPQDTLLSSSSSTSSSRGTSGSMVTKI